MQTIFPINEVPANLLDCFEEVEVQCRAPWVRVVEKDRQPTRPANDTKVAGTDSAEHGNRDPERHVTATKTIGWQPGCECAESGEPVPCIAMDIFSGTATVGAVAVGLGRSYIGLELSVDYAHLGRQRLSKGVAIPSAAAKPKPVKSSKGQASLFQD